MADQSLPIVIVGREAIVDDMGSSPDGSMSFVITEELEKAIEATSFVESLMTQSQFAQVLFPDVDEHYPNNRDLLCVYNTPGIFESVENDRIGLYRVPSFAPHDYVAFKWVTQEMIANKATKTFNVIFESNTLPKDEDFYQFQYLRGEQIFGASIPFQLKSGEEALCTMEDDEYMLIDRENDVAHRSLLDKVGSLASENQALKVKLIEVETNTEILQSKCTELNEEIQSRESLLMSAQGKLESIEGSAGKEIDQLRTDFAFALQDKLVLEERYHKAQKTIKTLQTDRDFLEGEVQKVQRRNGLLEEEISNLRQKADVDKDMVNAMTKAKDLAMSEIKANMVKNDEIKRKMDRMNRDLEATSVRNENLKKVLESMKAEFEILEKSKEAEIKNRDLEMMQIKTEMEQKDEEIQRLQTELKNQQEVNNLLLQEKVENSKAKFERIHVINEKLSETEKMVAKFMNGGPYIGGATCSSDIESLSQIEMFGNNSSEQVALVHQRIQKLQEELLQIKETHSEEIKSIKDELESIRSSTMNNSVNSSFTSNDSRHLLDFNVIQNQMMRASQVREETPVGPTEQPEAEKQKNIIEFLEEDNVVPAQPPPIPPRRSLTEAKITIEEDEDSGKLSFGNFWPPLQSVLGHFNNIMSDHQMHDDREIDELANWARGDAEKTTEENVSSTESSLASVLGAEATAPDDATDAAAVKDVLITDDGRIVVSPKDKLNCPFCDKEFPTGAVERLQFHVEAHMERRQQCPICDQIFEIENEDRAPYERHVQEHFPEPASLSFE